MVFVSSEKTLPVKSEPIKQMGISLGMRPLLRTNCCGNQEAKRAYRTNFVPQPAGQALSFEYGEIWLGKSFESRWETQFQFETLISTSPRVPLSEGWRSWKRGGRG